MPLAFALFDTAIGACGVVWTPAGAIAAVALPEADGRGDADRGLRAASPRRPKPSPPPP